MRRLIRWLARRIEYADRIRLQAEVEERGEKIRQLCVELVNQTDDHSRDALQKETELAKLRSDVEIRDNEIGQLTAIIKRNRKRVDAETALLVRMETQATHGEQAFCPTCRRLI